ncbi:MAG: penicillin acylase family protein, partial [Planctomycetota bacterium]
MRETHRLIRLTCRIVCQGTAWLLLASFALAADGYGKVELVRDRWGVPHVFAETDAGAMYGLGYATAEDRGFQMHYSLRIMQGRLAEVIGDVKKVGRNETALDNDRKMRTFGFHRAAKELVRHLDEESVTLLQAYSKGVNEYFRKNGDKLHELYEKVGLEPETWTPADCILSWWHLAQFFATDGTRDLIRYRNLTEGRPDVRRAAPARGVRPAPGRGVPARGGLPPDVAELKRLPPDESTAVVQREDVTDAWLQRVGAFLRKHGYKAVEDQSARARLGPSRPKFSHAWVADGRTTGTGSAVLVSEPRTPVANPSLLYEFHIRGKTFDARGVGVAGSPVILIGFSGQVAWGMTALGADQADLFRLKTDDDHPDQYEFDGEWRRMRLVREQIKVKGGRTQSILIRETHLGPVVNEFAFSRPGDPPVALKRIPICETDRDTIQGALAMIRARDVRQFFRALEGWRFPSANVVFGDRQGGIGFSLIGALVLRSPLAPEGGGSAQD